VLGPGDEAPAKRARTDPAAAAPAVPPVHGGAAPAAGHAFAAQQVPAGVAALHDCRRAAAGRPVPSACRVLRGGGHAVPRTAAGGFEETCGPCKATFRRSPVPMQQKR